METQRKIKEKLKFILRSEKTTKFLDIISSLNLFINNSPGNTNTFIDKVFGDEEDIIIELTNSHNRIDDIVIFDKRIMIRTISTNTNRFAIKSFNQSKKNKLSKDEMFEAVKEKLNFYDFVFFIRSDKNERTEPFKVLYKFYLIPIGCFTTTIDEDFVNWIYQSNKSFCLKVYNNFLDKFSLDYAYSYNY